MDNVAKPRIGTRAVIIIAVVVICLLGSGAYFLFGRNPQVKESLFSQFEDPLIRRHLAAQANQRQQRFTSQIQGSPRSTRIEVDGTNANQPAGLSKVTEGDRTISEVVSFGNTYYVKDLSDQKWWQQDLAQNTNDETTGSQLFNPATYFKELQQVDPETSYTKLADEPCGALQCHKYEQKDQGTVSAVLWFDTEQFLLQKSEQFLPQGKNSVVYSYDAIALGPPANTKPVPSGMSITGFIGTPIGVSNEPSNKLNAEQQQKFDEIRRQLGN